MIAACECAWDVQKYHILPQQFDPVPLPPPTDSCDDHASGFESDGGAVVRSRHRNRAYSGTRDARDGYHHTSAPYHQQLARSQPALAYAVHGGGGGGGGCRDDCSGPRPLGDGVSATSAGVLRGGRDVGGMLANSTHSVARSYAGGPLSTASNSTAVLRHQASLSLPPNQFARHPVSFSSRHFVIFLSQVPLYIVIFTRESSYCFQRVLAIAVLSACLPVCLSVCHTGGSVKNGAS